MQAFHLFAALVVWAFALYLGLHDLLDGSVALGVVTIALPLLWFTVCAIALRVVAKRNIQSRMWRVGVQMLLVTWSLLGGAFGEFLSAFGRLGMNYGNDSYDIALGSPLFFGLGLAIALVPSLLISVIAAALNIQRKHSASSI